MTYRRTKPVRASDLGQAAYCPKALELKQKGVRPTRVTQQHMKRGNRRHEDFNHQVSRDSRCFVASYVYGHDAEQTHTLRQWRDEVLLMSPVGRVFVSLYYAFSPMFVSLAQRIPFVGKVLKRMTDWVLTRIKETQL